MESSKHSILERHTINLDDKQKTSITFYSYYNNASPIYYELEPLIKVFKFTKELEIIAQIPKDWIKRASEFSDSVFSSRSVALNTAFVEATGIAFLISQSENKSLANTVTNLYNMCIRKTENDRVKRINTKIVTLKKELDSQKEHIESITKQFYSKLDEMKRMHETHANEMSTKHSFIKDALDVLTENHVTIQGVLRDLFAKL